MGATLLIMAAGMGSRYGGNKQVDGLGPNGEILMEYSIHDAIRAGFDHVVFVIKPGMKELIASICGERIAKKVKVDYVYQDFSSVPSFYQIPAGRTKPFGTVHAVLVAKDVIHQPFCVLNADDYYGVSAFKTAYDKLQTMRAEGEAAMVGYQLRNTVSQNGTVSRGVCVADEKNNLVQVVETLKIKLCENGEIRDIDKGEPGELLDPLAPVSMNFWGFTPWIFGKLEAYFEAFLKGLAPDAIKAECLLPVFVDSLMHSGELTVEVLSTDAQWFGVTYKEDKPTVQADLRALHESGVYPASLHE
ncbi:MAG: sugar phosphate nucleotidyltransferase [Clostridia bacterium]|nr:sugar phosphate nucleotidyltransferase [Clostridia bacterium]